MELEINNCVKNENSSKHVAMDEEFKELVKMLERKFLLSSLAILKAHEEMPTKIHEVEAPQCKPNNVKVKSSNHQNSISKEKSSEAPNKVKKVDVDDIDVGECLMKAADLCCQEQDDVKSSVLSNDKVDESEVEKSNQDWNYRHSMWWLNFQRKVIYDKIRRKSRVSRLREI